MRGRWYDVPVRHRATVAPDGQAARPRHKATQSAAKSQIMAINHALVWADRIAFAVVTSVVRGGGACIRWQLALYHLTFA